MDLSGSSEVSPADVATTTREPAKAEAPAKADAAAKAEAPAKAKAPKTRLSESKEAIQKLYPVEMDHSRDSLLTDFGKDTLQDRYLLPANPIRICLSGSPRLMPTMPPTPSGSTIIFRSSGSCRRLRCCPTAAPAAGFRSAAI